MSVKSITTNGVEGLIIDIECHFSNNLPNIIIVGFANKAVDEAKERIRGAFATSHIVLPRKRITVNLAPADVPKANSSFDLAIAMSILVASQQILKQPEADNVFIGELGLDGSVRPVRGLIGKLLAGRSHGINTFFIPVANLAQARLVPGIKLIPIDNLQSLIAYFNHGYQKQALPKSNLKSKVSDTNSNLPTVSEIVGQKQAKRALEIAAAGGHNLLLNGPPGTGKSMLAKALLSILPALTREEQLEISHLHSLASPHYEQVMECRPFRSPHHSASHVAVVGGGNSLRPGEITLAHRGVLFVDELPEFARNTLEALRQPLEDRVINVSRAKDSVTYPANFILIATANPCPCGYFGSNKSCQCSAWEIQRYQKRLSGPIMDRIDLHSFVHEVEHDKLLTQKDNHKADASVSERVASARMRQRNRFHKLKLNADMTNRDIKAYGRLSQSAVQLINRAAKDLNLSARGYMRTIKVARTIADLDNSELTSDAHISEALVYRAETKTQALLA